LNDIPVIHKSISTILTLNIETVWIHFTQHYALNIRLLTANKLSDLAVYFVTDCLQLNESVYLEAHSLTAYCDAYGVQNLGVTILLTLGTPLRYHEVHQRSFSVANHGPSARFQLVIVVLYLSCKSKAVEANRVVRRRGSHFF
jgi:hypothetical protein